MEQKEINTKILLKSGFWYTAAFFFSRAMVFLTMPLFTRLLTNEEYGDFSIFANWQSILLIIFGLEIHSTINRARFDYKQPGELDEYISSSLVLCSLFTGTIFILYLIIPNLFDRLFLLDRKYMMIMFAYLFTYPAFAVFHAKQRVEYRYKLSTIIVFVILVLSYALAIVLTINLKSERLLGRIFGQYIFYIIAGILFYISFIRKSNRISVQSWKYALRIGLPLVFAYLGSQILLSSDSIVVKHMCTGEEVSYLGIIHSCSHIVLLLVRAVNTAWAPWFYDMLKEKKYQIIRKTYQIYLWAVVVCTFAVVLVGPEIISVLGGKKYAASVDLLPAYILCGVFTVLTAHFSNLETYYKKTEYAAIFTAIAAVINIVLNIIGVKFWGYRAVCYATLFSQLVLITLHYCFSIKMEIKKLLPMRSMIFPLALSLVMIPCVLMLYQNNIVRYITMTIIMIIGVTVLILKRRKIKSIIIGIKK